MYLKLCVITDSYFYLTNENSKLISIWFSIHGSEYVKNEAIQLEMLL